MNTRSLLLKFSILTGLILHAAAFQACTSEEKKSPPSGTERPADQHERMPHMHQNRDMDSMHRRMRGDTTMQRRMREMHQDRDMRQHMDSMHRQMHDGQ